MRSAKEKPRPHSSNSADHEVESSNSTASLFLGGRRKSWMLDSQQPRPEGMPNSSSIHSFQRRPSPARASAGPSRPTVSAPESVLMSPVTPGESLQQHHYDAVSPLPPTNPSVSTTITTKATTPAIPMPASTSAPAGNIHAFPTNQFSALPSPDPSNPSHPSPSSAVDQTGEVFASPAATPAQIQPPQPQAQNSPLAGDVASVQAGGMNAGDNNHQDTTTAPPHQSRQEVARSPLMSPMSTSGVPNAGAPEITIDNSFWVQCQKTLNAFVAQSQSTGLSESVELPRLRLLGDACNSQDLLYLALHQVYCFSTFAPREFASLPGFSGKSTHGLNVLEQLLVENHRLSGIFLKWCVHFPNAPQGMMKSPQYRAALKQVPQCLTLLHEHWTSYDAHVRSRGYPPLIDELVVRFGVTSSVMLSIIFLAMCRRLYGNRHEMKLRQLFLQNKQNYDHRFAEGCSTTPEQMQRENERLIQAYLSLSPMHVNSPWVMPVAPSLGSPQINSPQLVTAASRSSPFFGPQPLPHLASPATMSPHGNGSQGQTTPATAQTGIRNHPTMNARFPPAAGTNQFHRLAPNPNVRIPGNAANQPPSQNMATMPYSSPDLNVDGAPRYQHYNPHFMLIQQMFGNPLPASTQQAASPRPPQPRPSATNVQARANTGVNRQCRPSGSAVPSGGSVAGSQPSRLATPHTTLLPQPGWVPVNTVRPNPLRVALHQAHLRDPVLKMVNIGEAGGEEETELFQYLQSFMVAPSPLGLVECAFQWQFTLSNTDCQRLPRISSRGAGERPLRTLTQGLQTYRFRCITVPPSATELPGRSWSVAETAWPSLLYIFVNGIELYVRRKVHNGKDLPLDITDYLKRGVNSISMYVIRSPAESKDVFYVAGVEVLDIAGYDYVKSLAQNLPASESRAQIKQRLSSRAEDEELSIVNDDLTVNLVDPFMARIFNIPARGITCAHQECFDLDTFLMTRASKSGKGPMTENWKCPICGADARPHSLIIDGFLAEVHAELKRTNQLDDARAIQIKADESWELKIDKDAQAAEDPKNRKTNDAGPSAAKRKHNDPTSSASPLPQRRLKTEATAAATTITTTTRSASAGRSSQPPVIELD